MRRTVAALACAVALALCLTGCSSSDGSESNHSYSLDASLSVGPMSASYPSSWSIEYPTDGQARVTADGDVSVVFQWLPGINYGDGAEQEFIGGITDSPQNVSDESIDGYSGKKFDCTTDIDGTPYNGKCVFVAVGDGFAAMYALYNGGQYESAIDDMAASIEITQDSSGSVEDDIRAYLSSDEIQQPGQMLDICGSMTDAVFTEDPDSVKQMKDEVDSIANEIYTNADVPEQAMGLHNEIVSAAQHLSNCADSLYAAAATDDIDATNAHLQDATDSMNLANDEILDMTDELEALTNEYLV